MSAERPTIKEVYDLVDARLQEIPNRREMRLTIALAVLGSSGAASVLTTFITRVSPPKQAATLFHFFF